MTLNLNSELAILECSGSDAATYLQGQLSNDIRELNNKPWQFSAHLSNKGRTLATFIITQHQENSYYLITNKDVADKILPRLKMYILRSKVTLAISAKSIYLNDTQIDGGHNLQLSADKYLTISENPQESTIDSNAWHKFLVENTLPMIYLESIEKIIPQQINYDLIGGINFKKGCYTGQEIVARTHYLGKVKRRMAKFTTNTQPQVGQSVVSPLMDNQEVGVIIDCYQDGQNHYGLVSLQNNCLDSAYLDTDNQQKLTCTTLIDESTGA
ncbi:MAG: hypothetical protein K2X04_02890 [Burkholderiales bacterium]|jgi:hypothetical protein|nr:hypothetical protein [Burkholderiales bacterium]